MLKNFGQGPRNLSFLTEQFKGKKPFTRQEPSTHAMWFEVALDSLMTSARDLSFLANTCQAAATVVSLPLPISASRRPSVDWGDIRLHAPNSAALGSTFHIRISIPFINPCCSVVCPAIHCTYPTASRNQVEPRRRGITTRAEAPTKHPRVWSPGSHIGWVGTHGSLDNRRNRRLLRRSLLCGLCDVSLQLTMVAHIVHTLGRRHSPSSTRRRGLGSDTRITYEKMGSVYGGRSPVEYLSLGVDPK